MRKIILDTETSGLNPKEDRIIEIACLELINDIPTGNIYHKFFSPGNIRISPEAEKVHGLSNNFLSKYGLFDNQVDEVLDFLEDSPIIMHNVSFDLSMINSSLERLRLPKLSEKRCVCTLIMARKLFPGSKVNLNALCRRYKISIESREKHDAVTDCFLLAQVYMELIGGKQHKFNFFEKKKKILNLQPKQMNIKLTPEITVDKHELDCHEEMLSEISNSLWQKHKN